MIRHNLSDSILTVFPVGRIDSTNADAAGEDINSLRTENEHTVLVLDLRDFDYISSAGLRQILKLKKAEKELRIINASPEVYDIFDMTGFAEMIDISRAFAKRNVDDCKVIGKGAKGTVYRLDPDTIIKVYNDQNSLSGIKKERDLAKRAFVLGIPTAISFDIVQVGDKYGSVFELLDCKTLTQLIHDDPDNMDHYADIFTELLRLIHSTEVDPGEMPDVKLLVRKWIDSAIPELEPEDGAKLTEIFEAVPDVSRMLHCDYHSNNIMINGDEALLIDMDTLSHGHPVFELANIHIAYVGFGEIVPEIVEDFIGLPYDTSKLFWDKFIRKYFDGISEEKLQEYLDKICLMSYVRLLRHFVRRNGHEDPVGRQYIEYCRTKIHEILKTTDSLLFD